MSNSAYLGLADTNLQMKGCKTELAGVFLTVDMADSSDRYESNWQQTQQSLGPRYITVHPTVYCILSTSKSPIKDMRWEGRMCCSFGILSLEELEEENSGFITKKRHHADIWFLIRSRSLEKLLKGEALRHHVNFHEIPIFAYLGSLHGRICDLRRWWEGWGYW